MQPHIRNTNRPMEYDETLATRICSEIASTSKGIKTLVKDNPNWPSHNTIYKWIQTYPSFKELYTRAKAFQIEVLVDEIISIADDSSQDYIVSDDGKLVCDHEHIQRAKLKIDTRKWLASKLCPRLYGDKRADEEKSPDDFISKYRDKLNT